MHPRRTLHRDRSPGGLAPLPDVITAGAHIDCDRRIVADVVWIAHRFRVRVTACYAIHATGGEHPLGAAVDLVPDPGRSWQHTTERLARALGWKRACAASGVAPACARPPFRFVGYDGYPSTALRDKLMSADFGAATIKINDARYNDLLAASLPAGIPFDPRG